MADGDGTGDNAEAPRSARILNQDEIENLLGCSEGGEKNIEKPAIEAIIDSGRISYECLPMLEVVFDRLVRMLSTSLRNFTSDTRALGQPEKWQRQSKPYGRQYLGADTALILLEFTVFISNLPRINGKWSVLRAW